MYHEDQVQTVWIIVPWIGVTERELQNSINILQIMFLLLFMSVGWYYVSELRPVTGLLFILQMIYEYGEPQCSDMDEGRPKNSENNLFSLRRKWAESI
jgi:hypothetical protein